MNELLVKEALRLLREARDVSLTVDEFHENLCRAIDFLQVALNEEELSREIIKRLHATTY